MFGRCFSLVGSLCKHLKSSVPELPFCLTRCTYPDSQVMILKRDSHALFFFFLISFVYSVNTAISVESSTTFTVSYIQTANVVCLLSGNVSR